MSEAARDAEIGGWYTRRLYMVAAQRCEANAVTYAWGTNPGAPKGNRNAWKHDGRSEGAILAAAYLGEIARLVRASE